MRSSRARTTRPDKIKYTLFQGRGGVGVGGLVCVISNFANFGWVSQRALMILVVPATNRREIEIFHTNSARSATFRKRVGPQLAYVTCCVKIDIQAFSRGPLYGDAGPNLSVVTAPL